MSCDAWLIDRSCLPELPEVPDELGDDPTDEEQAAYDAASAAYDLALAQRNAAEDLAVAVLHALSGRQFEVCEVTARPCPPAGWPRSPWVSIWDDVTGWFSTGCGCAGGCARSGPSAVHLPGPVNPPTDEEPIVVTIAGEELAADEFTLEGDVLYRRNGKYWPRQNLARPLGEPGTWSVTYRRGTPPPAGVDQLAGLLAKELLLACDDPDSCRLPRTVVSTTRRGVSHSFDPSKLYAAGKTGLAEVDLWLSAVNPHGLASPPVVL